MTQIWATFLPVLLINLCSQMLVCFYQSGNAIIKTDERSCPLALSNRRYR